MKKTLMFAAMAAFVGTGCSGGGRGGSPSSASTAATSSGGATSPGTIPGPTGPSAGGSGSTGGGHARVADYGDPSGVEQELLELTNRARKDPTAEGKRYGVDFSSYAPRPPVSYNKFLAQAALAHTSDMAARHFYAHINPDGVGPNGRILATPYDLNSAYGTDPSMNYSENIAAGINVFHNAKEVHQALIVDAGKIVPKHRNIILGVGTWAPCREAAYSYNTGNKAKGADYDIYIDEEFTRTKTDKPFVLGTVFNDKDLSGSYDDGEGVSGVTVTLTASDGWSISTTTATAGGYAFEIFDAGDYTVTVVGGGAFGTSSSSQKVTVGTTSVKVDGVVGLGAVVR
jgi:uncharacterized protein YkwD